MTSLAHVLRLAATTPWARKWGVSSRTPLGEWPVITRDDLAADPNQFLVPGWPRIARRVVRTGGSSGRPVEIWLDHLTYLWERKYQFEQWGRVGYQPCDWRFVLRGTAPRDDRLFTINRVRREIHTSAFHLTEARLDDIIGELPHRKRLWLHAYPSSALELVRLLRLRGSVNPLNFQGVLLGSENSTWEQRDFVAEHFGKPVYSWYGLSEKVALAGECGFSRQYHVNPGYGHVELLSEAGSPVTSVGTPARIVATGLINLCAPLVRYDTGDIAVVADDPCDCALPGIRLTNVVGRWGQDYVLTGAGTRVSVAALNLHGAEYRGLVGLQYLQKAAGAVEVRVVAPDWGPDNVVRLTDALRVRLPDTAVNVEIVDRLAAGPNGKTPLVTREVGE